MALTAAERQRRHRQKLRAEGKLPQKSSAKGRGKSNSAADRQQQWVMRLQEGWHCHGQPKMADATGGGGAVVQGNFGMNGYVERRGDVVGFDQAGVDPHNETNRQSEGIVPDSESIPQLRNDLQPSINDAVSSVDVKQEPVFEVTGSEAGLGSTHETASPNLSSEFNTGQDFVSPYNYHSNYLSAEFLKAQEKLLRKRQGNAERQRKRRKRMKEEGRYETYKQKHIIHCEKHRATKREIEKALPESLRREFIAKRREDGRRRVAQYRARKKQMAIEMQTSLASEDSVESGIQEPSGTGTEEPRRHAQRENVQRRFASWRNKKKLTLMSRPDGEVENDFGQSQSFVLCQSEPKPHEPSVAAFNPGIVPCTLVRCNTSAVSEIINPALSQADKLNPSGSQASPVGRTMSGPASRSKLTYCDRHGTSTTSSLAPYVILPSQGVSSEEDSNARSAVAGASQQDKPSSYPAAEVVPRYFTRPPIWPSSRSVTESLPQVGIHPNGQDYGRLQGTSQITIDLIQPDSDTAEPMEENLSHLQTDPSQTQTQSSQPILDIDNTPDAVSDDDQHHHVSMYDPPDGTDDEETPAVLQEDLQKIQSQFPMVHNYVKKLQSDIHKLREAYKKLTKRKIDLNDLKTNNDLLMYWTGFPDYSTFEDIFVTLKPSLVSTPCQNFTILSLEEEFVYVLSRIRTGASVTDIAERIGITEGEFNLIFDRWITTLPHKLQYIFKTRDERARTAARKPSISYDDVASDYKNVLIDCTDMFSEQVFLNCGGRPPAEETELCKFVMGISLPTATVVQVSDVTSAESGFVLLRLSRGKNDIMVPLGERDSWLVQGEPGQSPVERILRRVRSLKIVEDSEIKLQCQTFRSMVKVCLLLSNVIQE